jgi:putative transposase
MNEEDRQSTKVRTADPTWLSAWPVRRSPDWRAHVNAPQTEGELAALRRSLQRGVPFGGERWTTKMVARLGLQSTLRPRGRPRLPEKGS